jgi:hypothetical protein
LLGQIDKIEMDKEDFNGLWERQAAAINDFSEDELSNFFSFLSQGEVRVYPEGGAAVRR